MFLGYSLHVRIDETKKSAESKYVGRVGEEGAKLETHREYYEKRVGNREKREKGEAQAIERGEIIRFRGGKGQFCEAEAGMGNDCCGDCEGEEMISYNIGVWHAWDDGVWAA